MELFEIDTENRTLRLRYSKEEEEDTILLFKSCFRKQEVHLIEND